MLAAASLELKAEKQSAHSNYVLSVAFSPDGKTIVSGGYSGTLKVWDAGVWTLTPPTLIIAFDGRGLPCGAPESCLAVRQAAVSWGVARPVRVIW